MGIVYEAVDHDRDAKVALKTVRRRDASALARFKREFRALSDISHPNLVTLGELFGEGDSWFFTMELVEGFELTEWVRGGERADASGVYAMAATVESPAQLAEDRATRPARGSPPPYDLGRLRDALRQITMALSALHDAGKVHRDIKPSNIRVTPEGRVVVLDFGLVFEIDSAHGSTGHNLVGTPAYMAPEQAASSSVGPAADWYALGVILYECLTGELPFDGAPLAVLMEKQTREASPPSQRVDGVPPDLDELCVALLRFDPAHRCGAREIARCVEAKAPSAPLQHRSSASGLAPFVGRRAELSALSRALADVDAGKTVTVALHGESGIGKSLIVRRFLELHVAQRPGVVVLTGRCYERESVPYKAFDGVIDALTRRLARMPRGDAEALLPIQKAPLAHVFPVLCRLPAVAGAARTTTLTLEPLEIRRRAFAALRELLARLAARQSVVIVIDDLQWTDAESLLLLEDLLRPPDGPPLLLVVTLRAAMEDDDARVPPAVAAIPGDVRAVHVGRLDERDSRELAGLLIDRAGGKTADAATIIEETNGHPLFMDELVRHSMTAGGGAAATPRLDAMVWERVVGLEPSARRVLETVCVAGVPLAQSAIARAVGMEMASFARQVSLLRVTNLVRTSGARVTDAVEPYHDRVREAVISRLGADDRRELHERIADALEMQGNSDPEVLAGHWLAAGQESRAVTHMIVAAEQAAKALAFDRAARLYGSAARLLPTGDARTRALRSARGDAFANAGQGALAAQEYEAAAVGAVAADALDFRRRAADQLLRSGHVERGMDATRAVLAAVGLKLPESRLSTILQLVFLRFLVAVRGLGFRPRDPSEIARSELTRIDVCWSVSFALSNVDAMRGAVFQTRHLLRALSAGEPRRVARALAMETAYVAMQGFAAWPRTERLIERARVVSEEAGVYARALALGTAGTAHVLHSRNERGIAMLDRSADTLTEECPGSSWEVTSARFFAFCARAYSGRYVELIEMHDLALRSARARGDLYGGVMLRVGVLNRRWLVTNEPARARSELTDAMRSWTVAGFHTVHFHALLAESYIDWYEGKSEHVVEKIDAAWPALRRSLLLRVEAIRLECHSLRLQAVLQRAGQLTGAPRRDLLRRARRQLKAFARERAASVEYQTAVYRAGIASLEGDMARASRHLRTARAASASTPAHVSPALDWALAGAEGGADAARVQSDALARMRDLGIVAPLRFIRLILPGWPVSGVETHGSESP